MASTSRALFGVTDLMEAAHSINKRFPRTHSCSEHAPAPSVVRRPLHPRAGSAVATRVSSLAHQAPESATQAHLRSHPSTSFCSVLTPCHSGASVWDTLAPRCLLTADFWDLHRRSALAQPKIKPCKQTNTHTHTHTHTLFGLSSDSLNKPPVISRRLTLHFIPEDNRQPTYIQL